MEILVLSSGTARAFNTRGRPSFGLKRIGDMQLSRSISTHCGWTQTHVPPNHGSVTLCENLLGRTGYCEDTFQKKSFLEHAALVHKIQAVYGRMFCVVELNQSC